MPLFLTQGLTENNTVADGMAQYLENHTGYEQGWLGPWEHVRGNETDENGRLKMGRAGWFDETMRFYDRFLKGVEPSVQDPKWAIQTNDGKWYAEDSWKPRAPATSPPRSRTGGYTDDISGPATGSGAEEGLWTISKPLADEAHLAGSGKVELDVSKTLPTAANLVVDVYDLDAAGTGPLITRQGHLVRQDGKLSLDLWSADWKMAEGHRIGVRVTDANDDWWVHTGVPVGQTVTVKSGSVTLPFQTEARTRLIQGDPGVQLGGLPERDGHGARGHDRVLGVARASRCRARRRSPPRRRAGRPARRPACSRRRAPAKARKARCSVLGVGQRAPRHACASRCRPPAGCRSLARSGRTVLARGSRTAARAGYVTIRLRRTDGRAQAAGPAARRRPRSRWRSPAAPKPVVRLSRTVDAAVPEDALGGHGGGRRVELVVAVEQLVAHRHGGHAAHAPGVRVVGGRAQPVLDRLRLRPP